MTPRVRRRILAGLLTLPFVLLLADFLVWRAAEQQLRDGLDAWIATRRAAGWTVTSGPAAAGGWPLAVSLSVPDLVLSAGDAQFPAGLTWRAERLGVRVALLHPDQVVLAASGGERLRLGALPEVPFTADRLEATLPMVAGAPPQSVRLVADALRAELPAAAGVAALDLRLAWRPDATRSDSALTYALQADDVTLPPGPPARWPLGPHVSRIVLDGVISGPLPEPMLTAPLLTKWRDGGGTSQIRHLALRWGPLDLAATATVSLDAQLQPMGTASVRISGQAAALDTMAARGAIKPQAALAAKAILALLGSSAAGTPDSAPDSIDVPLTLQDRTIAMGRIPLVRVPQWTWPAAVGSASVSQ